LELVVTSPKGILRFSSGYTIVIPRMKVKAIFHLDIKMGGLRGRIGRSRDGNKRGFLILGKDNLL
jgi:hypothetical protein